jgi:hypothetical protein
MITDPSSLFPEYQTRNPVCAENLEQILAWIEHQAEINIPGANIRNFSSLSGKFCASQTEHHSAMIFSPVHRR